MLRSTLLAVSRNHRVRDAAVAFAPTRAVVQRFVAGETLDDCVRVCRELVADGLYATVDHLGEDTTTRAQAEATARAYLDLLARLDAVAAGMFCVSRTEAAKLISEGRVSLNYIECLRTDAGVKEHDVISIRGFGKGEITEIGGTTRRGRQFVNAEIYK